MSSPYPRDFSLLARILAMRKERLARLQEQFAKLRERRERLKRKRTLGTCQTPKRRNTPTEPSWRRAPAGPGTLDGAEAKQEAQGSSAGTGKRDVKSQGGDDHEG